MQRRLALCLLTTALLTACSGSDDPPENSSDNANANAQDNSSDNADPNSTMGEEDMKSPEEPEPDMGPDMRAPEPDMREEQPEPDMKAPSCEGTCEPAAPSCDEDVLVESAGAAFDDQCQCVQQEQRTDCAADGQSCDEALGECVAPSCEGTCEPAAPSCDEDVLVESAGATFDDQCQCVQQEQRTDCAASGQRCDEAAGSCVAATPCPPDMSFTGQIGGAGPFDGGTYFDSSSAYTVDSGLEAVHTFITQGFGAGTIAADELYMLGPNEQLQVQGATVTATGPFFQDPTFTDGLLLLQDRQRAMIAFFQAGDLPLTDVNGNPLNLRVGHRIDFTVTGVQVFEGSTPQIAAISEVRVVGTDQAIWVQEATGQALTLGQRGQIVRVGGQLTELIGDCGGATCWRLTHGATGEQIVYRSRMVNGVAVGACVTFVGPLWSFPGPLGMAPHTLQLNASNFDWAALRPSSP